MSIRNSLGAVVAAAAIIGGLLGSAPPVPAAVHTMGTYHGHYISGWAQLARALRLTPSQRTRINRVRARARAEMRAVKNNRNLTSAQRQARLLEIRRARMAEGRAILTPSQRRKLTYIRAHKP